MTGLALILHDLAGESDSPRALKRITVMSSTPHELAFALASPQSGPLAAVICALADLFEDPRFDEVQRAHLRALLDGGKVPAFLADRAAERLFGYAQTVETLHSAANDCRRSA